MSKEAEILRKCDSCHDEQMCQNQGNRGGSCISGVSVLQKVTLNVCFDSSLQRLTVKTTQK